MIWDVSDAAGAGRPVGHVVDANGLRWGPPGYRLVQLDDETGIGRCLRPDGREEVVRLATPVVVCFRRPRGCP